MPFIDTIVNPKSALLESDSEDYYKVRLYNGIFFVLILITFLQLMEQIGVIYFKINDFTSSFVVWNTFFILICVIGFYIFGKTSFYKIGLKLFPLLPLIAIWSYFTIYSSNASHIELFIINPEYIILFGLIIGGILLSIKEMTVFSFISIIDILSFYGLTTNFSYNWLLPRFLILTILSGLMILYANFRIVTFKVLSETNRQLTKEVAIKDKNIFNDRKLLYSLVANLKEGVLIINNDKKIILVNTSFKKLFKEILGKKMDIESILGSDIDETHPFSKFLSKIREMNSHSEILENKNKIYLLVFNHLVISQDEYDQRILLEIHDITQMKIIEMIEKRIHLVLMHELRTPITSLSLAVSNLLKYEDQINAKDKNLIYKTIKNQTDNLEAIITNISLLTFFESLKGNELTNQNLLSIINTIKSDLVNQAGNRKIEVIEFIDNENYLINIEQESIYVALKNILDNAVKFTKTDSTIFLRFFIQENEYFVTEIVDDGIGIPEEDLHHIFTRFYKAKNAENYSGMGIGLSTSHEIIKAHNGVILVKSKLNIGTTVKIILPVLSLKK